MGIRCTEGGSPLAEKRWACRRGGRYNIELLRGAGFEEEVINRRVTLASDTERAAVAEVAVGEAQPEADKARP